MKKFILLFVGLSVIVGCAAKSEPKKNVLVKINNYEITSAEFEVAYQTSSFSRLDTPQAREEFLSTLIDQKLILQSAQQEGLDKDGSFLKTVERFWEQSLLKVALDKHAQQIVGSLTVSDKDIEAMYTKMVKEGKTDKPFQSIYQQIKWEITQDKESKAMSSWVEELRSRANIVIDHQLLNSK